jgi:Tfp pilus assembly protein PilV
MRASIESGSTLIEAVVAVGILVTAVVSMAGLVSVAVKAVTLSRERTVAVLLAAQKVDDVSLALTRASAGQAGGALPDRNGTTEYLYANGAAVETASPARGAVLVRRAWVTPIRADASLAVVEVTVAICRRVADAASVCGDSSGRVHVAVIRAVPSW